MFMSFVLKILFVTILYGISIIVLIDSGRILDRLLLSIDFLATGSVFNGESHFG